MKNTLNDLNNYLFEAIERLNDDDLSEEQLDKEIKRSEAVQKVAKTIIENGQLAIVEELERAKSVIKDLMTDRYGSKCEFCIQDNNPDARCRKYFPGSGEWCCDNAAWNGKVFEEL